MESWIELFILLLFLGVSSPWVFKIFKDLKSDNE